MSKGIYLQVDHTEQDRKASKTARFVVALVLLYAAVVGGVLVYAFAQHITDGLVAASIISE